MPTGEILQFKPKEAPLEHVQELATKVGEKAANDAHELLRRHPDLVGPVLANLISNQEFSLAFQEALEGRNEGLLNDEASLAPGLTVYISRTGRSVLQAYLNENVADYVSEYVGSITEKPQSDKLFQLKLPNGIYSTDFGTVSLYGEAGEPAGDQWPNTSNPFSISYPFVVRIEGDSGELWQNPKFTPDGTPRE